MTLPLVFSVRDRKGALSTFQLNMPEGTSVPDAFSFANTLAQLYRDVGDGNLFHVKLVYEREFPDSPPAEVTSNVYTRLIALFTDGVEYRAITIPYPR